MTDMVGRQPHTPAALRHVQCLRLAAEGHNSAQIARKLHVSECTVKSDLGRARQALGARNTTHAVALGVAAGLIAIDNQVPAVDAALAALAHALGYDLALTPREERP